jgi:hypothetical protein
MTALNCIFWVHPEHKREVDLATAVRNGAKLNGDKVEIREVMSGTPEVEHCDLVMKVGVKSRDWFRAYQAAGIPYAYFDKGYIRDRAPDEWLEYWRLSVNGHQPLGYLTGANNTRHRADEMGLDFKPWRKGGRYVLLDGSSGKHYYFHADPTEFVGLTKQALTDALAARLHEVSIGIIERIRAEFPQTPIIYRPKPSFKYAIRIDGEAGGEPIQWSRGKSPAADLKISRCVVTAGSNLCFDAVLDGVPSIVLGDGITKPISSTSVSEIGKPLQVSDEERRNWLNNAAWCQFRPREFANGLGWQTIREMMVHCHAEAH